MSFTNHRFPPGTFLNTKSALFLNLLEKENWVEAKECYVKHKEAISISSFYLYFKKNAIEIKSNKELIQNYEIYWDKTETLELVRLLILNKSNYKDANALIDNSHIFKNLKEFETRALFKLLLNHTLSRNFVKKVEDYQYPLEFLFSKEYFPYTPKIDKMVREHKKIKEFVEQDKSLLVVLEQLKLKSSIPIPNTITATNLKSNIKSPEKKFKI